MFPYTELLLRSSAFTFHIRKWNLLCSCRCVGGDRAFLLLPKVTDFWPSLSWESPLATWISKASGCPSFKAVRSSSSFLSRVFLKILLVLFSSFLLLRSLLPSSCSLFAWLHNSTRACLLQVRPLPPPAPAPGGGPRLSQQPQTGGTASSLRSLSVWRALMCSYGSNYVPSYSGTVMAFGIFSLPSSLPPPPILWLSGLTFSLSGCRRLFSLLVALPCIILSVNFLCDYCPWMLAIRQLCLPTNLIPTKEMLSQKAMQLRYPGNQGIQMYGILYLTDKRERDPERKSGFWL